MLKQRTFSYQAGATILTRYVCAVVGDSFAISAGKSS